MNATGGRWRAGRSAGKEQQHRAADLRQQVIDITQGLTDLIAHGATGRALAEAERVSQRHGDVVRRQAVIAALGGAATQMLTQAALVAVLLVGVAAAGGVGEGVGPMLAIGAFVTLAAFEAVAPLPLAYQMLGRTRAAGRRLREVAEMRSSLESLALRHASPNMTRAILQEAEEVTRHGDSASTVRDWEAANRHFHRLILSPCRMPRLLRTIDDLQAASARFLFAAWRRDWEARTDHDHRAILDALRKGQTDLACATLARHVGWIGKRKTAVKNADLRETYEIPG